MGEGWTSYEGEAIGLMERIGHLGGELHASDLEASWIHWIFGGMVKH